MQRIKICSFVLMSKKNSVILCALCGEKKQKTPQYPVSSLLNYVLLQKIH